VPHLADSGARVPKILPTAELEGFLTGLQGMPLETEIKFEFAKPQREKRDGRRKS